MLAFAIFVSSFNHAFGGFFHFFYAGSFQHFILTLQLLNIFLPVTAAQFAGNLLMGTETVMYLQDSSFDLFLGVKRTLHRADPPRPAPCSAEQRVIKKARRFDTPACYGLGKPEFIHGLAKAVHQPDPAHLVRLPRFQQCASAGGITAVELL